MNEHIRYVDTEVARLRQRITELEAMLRRLEWHSVQIDGEHYRRCQICGNYRRHGHHKHCELKRLLAEADLDTTDD